MAKSNNPFFPCPICGKSDDVSIKKITVCDPVYSKDDKIIPKYRDVTGYYVRCEKCGIQTTPIYVGCHTQVYLTDEKDIAKTEEQAKKWIKSLWNERVRW